MDEKLERKIKIYIWRVGCYIICERKIRKNIKNDIYDAVYSFAEEHGISTMQEIYDEFGTPKKLASAHLGSIDPDKVMKYRSTLLCTAIVALIMLAIFFITTYADAHKSYYTDCNVEQGETKTSLSDILY